MFAASLFTSAVGMKKKPKIAKKRLLHLLNMAVYFLYEILFLRCIRNSRVSLFCYLLYVFPCLPHVFRFPLPAKYRPAKYASGGYYGCRLGFCLLRFFLAN